ncbi:MAG: DUF5063 domain-containing protein [Planctomycetes bacterium]|nr:DUF5063 domain-containing protein [Planctomycetota bacterium]
MAAPFPACPAPDSVDAFACAAAEFVGWCEAAAGEPEAEAHAVLRHLVDLYSLALRLHMRDCDLEPEPVGRADDAAWRAVFERCAALPFSCYASVFDPRSVRTGAAELDMGDLADDLADIYRDLTSGLSLYRAGHRETAEWDWCVSFRNHWGRHATGALRALHCWAADEAAW